MLLERGFNRLRVWFLTVVVYDVNKVHGKGTKGRAKARRRGNSEQIGAVSER
jgi:hypothetical protein